MAFWRTSFYGNPCAKHLSILRLEKKNRRDVRVRRGMDVDICLRVVADTWVCV